MRLQVMFPGNFRAVSKPVSNDMKRIFFDKLRLPACPQILESFLPGFQLCPFDDPMGLCSEVDTYVYFLIDYFLLSWPCPKILSKLSLIVFI